LSPKRPVVPAAKSSEDLRSILSKISNNGKNEALPKKNDKKSGQEIPERTDLKNALASVLKQTMSTATESAPVQPLKPAPAALPAAQPVVKVAEASLPPPQRTSPRPTPAFGQAPASSGSELDPALVRKMLKDDNHYRNPFS
jgi:hypothetical protein